MFVDGAKGNEGIHGGADGWMALCKRRIMIFEWTLGTLPRNLISAFIVNWCWLLKCFSVFDCMRFRDIIVLFRYVISQTKGLVHILIYEIIIVFKNKKSTLESERNV